MFHTPPPGDWQPVRLSEDTFDLTEPDILAIDLECYDPNLKEAGPGEIRKDGEIIGVAIAAKGIAQYWPLVGEHAVDRSQLWQWIHRDLYLRKKPVLGANFGGYDALWLQANGTPLNMDMYDIQIAEPLLDEEAPGGFSLEALGQRYCGIGKIPNDINWDDPYSEPTEKMGKYAQHDAWLTLEVRHKQRPLLDEQGLWDIFQLETDVLQVTRRMRAQGVRVDLEYAEMLNMVLHKEEEKLMAQIEDTAGFMCNPWASADVARVLDKLGIEYPLSPKLQQPSITQDYLSSLSQSCKFAAAILDFRQVNKMRRDFIEGGVLKWNINGRIHPQIHTLRKDDSGTRSGRFSYSNPNLQQIPSRHPRFGPMIRSMYIPEDGEQWYKFDYSQQEPRIGLHFAYLRGFRGAKKMVEQYQADPKTDYYTMVAEEANIGRREAKNIKLGLDYGMGKKKLANELGVDMDRANELFFKYHQAVPFAKQISEDAMNLASSRGWIRTLLGRRRHFNLWWPTEWKRREQAGYRAYPLEEAQEKWAGIGLCRAYTHKAYNALIQGSAADMTKKAMVTLFKEMSLTPLVQVHDELDLSLPLGDDDLVGDIASRMENCVDLVVPVVCDVSTGKNWGEAK